MEWIWNGRDYRNGRNEEEKENSEGNGMEWTTEWRNGWNGTTNGMDEWNGTTNHWKHKEKHCPLITCYFGDQTVIRQFGRFAVAVLEMAHVDEQHRTANRRITATKKFLHLPTLTLFELAPSSLPSPHSPYSTAHSRPPEAGWSRFQSECPDHPGSIVDFRSTHT